MTDVLWHPMSEAPKDGTKVKLRLEDMDGPYEIYGEYRWAKIGTWPPRWVRVDNIQELFVAPHSWRPVEEKQTELGL